MENNNNSFKFFSVLVVALFAITLSAVSVSALSLITEFEDGSSYNSIMPGESAKYYVMGVADQGLSKMQVTAQFYDITTGEKVYLGNLFNMSTIDTFFYPDIFTISPNDFTELPGSYIIGVKAEEWLSNGIYRAKTSELNLEVIGNRLPVAQFDYSPLNPTTVTPVTFDSSSYDTDGYLVKQEWFSNSVKIGEGDIFTYTFPKPGVYSITLTVTDNEGATASATKQVTVTQGAIYPVADFIYNPAEPETNQQITFTSTSYDTDGIIVKEEWDFNNDGVFETVGHSPVKSFAQPGSYRVTLKVTDNSNLQASVSKVVVVKQTPVPNVPPVAAFTYTPNNITVNQTVTFTSTSYDTDGYLVSQDWYINNVLAGSGNTLSKTFSTPGTYTITLTVKDDDGALDSETKQIYVNDIVVPNIPPVANFNYSPNKNITVNQSISFISTSYDVDGRIVKEEWDFNNDGLFELSYENGFIGSQLAKHFSQPGSYPVSLRVTDDDGAKATVTKVIVVVNPTPANKPPVANFTYTQNNICNNNICNQNVTCNESVTFTSTSFDPDGYLVSQNWYINGVFVKSGVSMTKIFSTSGKYNITLTVKDDDGAQSSLTKQITVSCPVPPANKPPVADFVYSPLNPVVNQSVVFTSTSYDVDGSIVKEEWDLNNDGLFTWTGHSVTKVFTAPGSYPVSLRVTDDDGAKATVTKVIVVVNPTPANKPPVADFKYSPCDNIICNQTVVFTSTSYDADGYLVSQNWYVNGVFVGSGVSMNRTFSTSGTYSITLTIKDDDGALDSETKQIKVNCTVPPANKPPVADFVYSPLNPVVNQSVVFTSTSYDVDGSIVREEWDLNNDGLFTWTGHSVTKVFTAPGSYPVTLRVYDNSGANATVTKVIVVVNPTPANKPPVANFVYTPSAPETNQQVIFTSTSYDSDGTIVKEEWDLDNNGVFEFVGHSVSKMFAQPGNYVVSLRVTDDDGATAKVSKTIAVSNAACPPTAVLRMPESVTMNTLVKLDGSLSIAGCNNTITSYKWQIFKQNVSVSEFSTVTPYATYNFSSNMQYRVVLTVYNSEGLSDSDEKSLFAGRPHQGIVVGSEDDLYVDYFDVIGTDYGVIECTQSFAISATVSNDREEDIEDLRITFAIPELGYKIKSAAFDLDAGKTKTITFYGDLDMMMEEVIPGEYYAFIGASDTDTIRVKYFPLIIN